MWVFSCVFLWLLALEVLHLQMIACPLFFVLALGGLNCPGGGGGGGGGLRNEGHSWVEKNGELLPPNCTQRTTYEVFC